MQVNTCWTEESDLDTSLSILKSLAHDHLVKGGIVGAQILKLIAEDDWAGVVNFELDYKDDWDVLQLIECRQGLGFFTKLEPIEIGLDKTDVAIAKFIDAERVCGETNSYFRMADSGSFMLLPFHVRLLEAARRKIRTVLGVCPKADNLKFHFGPGATTDLRKRSASPTDKMSMGFSCSSSMLASGLLPTYLRAAPHWLSCFESQETEVSISDIGEEFECTQVPVSIGPGRLTCVPKSAKTYRTIMVEPCLNGFVQQGIRHAMERRMSFAGLSTRDQSRNARLARAGSLSGELATIDLSSASDLISFSLVKRLLPPDWFSLLCSARTGAVQMPDGDVLSLEKFSSMGNAYTFPLETLVFWAISTSALDIAGVPYTSEDIAVYGDDIIIPSCGYEHVCRALVLSGFAVNMEKSFFEGPFRESCGHDYYKGIDIRPYYQKALVSGRSLFSMHNFFYRKFDFYSAERVLHHIPESLRVFGPDGYGDGHLLGTWPRKRLKRHVERGFSGYVFDTFTLKPRKAVTRFPGDFVSPLYSVYVNGRSALHDCVPVDEVSPGTAKAKDGRTMIVYPGFEGYKRISIYTLDS
jgi:hypothetical protein